ncbi:MAG: Hsp20/alpha crystallin family protein [Alphaproteobacteria bacterium]|nr:Hsp20/alpha crystallin family protein [Alphaproteobacteria bacterium]
MQNQITNSQSKAKIPASQNFFTTLLNLLDVPQSKNIIQAEPKIEVSENKENVMVTAEIPGISEKDIELEISTNGYLTISGEKKHENTKYSTNGGYFSEISYGRISRTVPLPWDLQYDKAFADYNNGVLTVTLPKATPDRSKRKKININKGEKVQKRTRKK